ncbi:MAG: hypothetical protein IT180_03395 [Acidobacteria bacterium]|nr:hypothetical protein [Acidobacteriota bacterium]
MRTRLSLTCLALLLIAPAAHRLAQRRSPVGDWTHHGGDAGSTKYAPLDQITPANVGSLRIAWRRPAVSRGITAAHPKLVAPRNFRATPLEADGMLFASNAIGLAEAVEPESGRTVWTQEVPPREVAGPGASLTGAADTGRIPG